MMSPPTVQDPYRSHQPDTALGSNQPPPLADLPPVEAPSASFVVQLFVIPAVVVAVVIVVWLLFGKLAGGERDAMEYVRQLRLSSANWRSAFELASLIQNDSQLASDPRLLGELTDLVQGVHTAIAGRVFRYVGPPAGLFCGMGRASVLQRALGARDGGFGRRH